jgi:rhodanese-related sulfurtransferase
VASFLKHKGIKETAALLGGLDAWKAAGLRLEMGSGERRR